MNGQSIAGYRVIRRIGGGGMGEVFEVAHPRLPRRDALKLLHSSVSTNPQYKGRFEREAYLLAQLNHRNIVHLYDRGEFDGRLWITMEYVAGPDTARILAEKGPLPLDLAIEIAAGTADGLDYAYRQAQVTHRDIKPANILVAFDADGAPQVKIADFGIAKAAGESLGITSTGITVGTMAYMSPEAFDNKILDNRADLYSLACTVFEFLTGTPPFPGDSPAAVIAAHLNQPVPRITGKAPHLPAHLDAVFRKALAKRPEDRYASGAEFVAGLRGQIPRSVPAHTAPQPIPTRETPVPGATGPVPTRAETLAAHAEARPAPTRAEPLPPLPHAEFAQPVRRRRRSPILAAAVLIIVAAVAAAAFFFLGNPSNSDAPAVALTPESVRLINFQGTPDSSPNIANVLTGASPSWRTDYYLSGPGFGGLKSGLGLLITLEKSAVLSGGTITSPSTGSTVRVTIPTSDSFSSVDETTQVWQGALGSGDTSFTASGAPESKYVLVWITGLAQSQGKWYTTIEQVQLRGK